MLRLIVWPSGFRARLDSFGFALLDDQGQLVAKGGELLAIGGGALVKKDDPRMLGHEAVFITSARRVSREALDPR